MPWDKMYGLRNLIAHEYFGMDHQLYGKLPEIIYLTIKDY
jgi:Protein of unknown function DUF86.